MGGDVVEFIGSLVKTMKSKRLYQENNAIIQQQLHASHQHLERCLSKRDALLLHVSEKSILFEKTPVYENANPEESLAFRFFRDGIRELTLLPGMTQRELNELVACLNANSRLDGGEDDLTILLWEREFPHLHYAAVEEKADKSFHRDIKEQMDKAVLDPSKGVITPPRISIEPKDLKQPLKTIPVTSCQLGEDELARLREELQAEERQDLTDLLVRLVAELILHEDSDAEKQELADFLPRLLEGLLQQGALGQTRSMLAGTAELAKDPALTWAQKIHEGLRLKLGAPASINQLIQRVNEGKFTGNPADLYGVLVFLEGKSAQALVGKLGAILQPKYRRAAADGVAQLAAGREEALAGQLASRIPEDPALAVEWAHMLGRLAAKASGGGLAKLASHSDPAVRREALQALAKTHAMENAATDLFQAALYDPDAAVRELALASLVKRGGDAAASKVLAAAETAKNLSDTELRHWVMGAAKAAGPDALVLFSGILQKGGWLSASKRLRSLQKAVAAGLHLMGTNEARRILERFSKEGDRSVRQLCQEALGK